MSSSVSFFFTRLAGTVFLVMGLFSLKDAIELPSNRGRLLTLSGPFRLVEKKKEGGNRHTRLFRRDIVFAQLFDYPGLFELDKKTMEFNAASLHKSIRDTDLIRVSVSEKDLPRLYTRTTLKAYEVRTSSGTVLFSTDDARRRDRNQQYWLYAVSVLLLVCGILLLRLRKSIL